jgi:hypothetical protein
LRLGSSRRCGWRPAHSPARTSDTRPSAFGVARSCDVPSHGAPQMRLQIDANGLGPRAMRYASSKRPSAMART